MKKAIHINPQAMQLAKRLKKSGTGSFDILGQKVSINFSDAQIKINHVKGSVSVFIFEIGQWLVFDLKAISSYLTIKRITRKKTNDVIVMVPRTLIG